MKRIFLAFFCFLFLTAFVWGDLFDSINVIKSITLKGESIESWSELSYSNGAVANVLSINSATGTVTLSVINTTNNAGVASWNGTELQVGTNILEVGNQYNNVITPVIVSTNVSGTWTIDLTTNAAVSIYEQVGNITSVVFSVDSTNDVALGQVLLLATTNAITWPTNGLTWAAGAAPTTVSNQYNRLYFEAWRDAVFGVYVGANP